MTATPAGAKSVERDEMTAAAGHIQQGIDDIEGIRSRMQTQMSTLNGNWTSRASRAYASATEATNQEFLKVIQGLQEIHVALTGNQAAYTQTEEETTAAVRSGGLDEDINL